MGASLGVVQWLRDQGHDAVHLSEEGLQRAADLDIFAKAIVEQRIVLTFDLDFAEIAALSQGQKASVILFRLHNTRTPHVISRLAVVLAECVPALESGAVVIVEEARFRVRPLPIGSTFAD
jgi:predicted nuclease of predicted toxin-antitoxin system